MNTDQPDAPSSTEVFRYGGPGTLLLISLLAFIGLQPLVIEGQAARIAGALILAAIFVTSTMTASRSPVRRVISIVLATSALSLQATWLATGNTTVEIGLMAVFAAYCLYIALVILLRVLEFGPIRADRVHAALSVYILLAMFWAGLYALIDLLSPDSFAIAEKHVHLEGAYLFANMLHLSIATLTTTGFGDITPVSPFARSMSQLEQITGMFYIAVLISRLVARLPSKTRL